MNWRRARRRAPQSTRCTRVCGPALWFGHSFRGICKLTKLCRDRRNRSYRSPLSDLLSAVPGRYSPHVMGNTPAPHLRARPLTGSRQQHLWRARPRTGPEPAPLRRTLLQLQISGHCAWKPVACSGLHLGFWCRWDIEARKDEMEEDFLGRPGRRRYSHAHTSSGGRRMPSGMHASATRSTTCWLLDGIGDEVV